MKDQNTGGSGSVIGIIILFIVLALGTFAVMTYVQEDANLEVSTDNVEQTLSL